VECDLRSIAAIIPTFWRVTTVLGKKPGVIVTVDLQHFRETLVQEKVLSPPTRAIAGAAKPLVAMVPAGA